MLFITGLAKNKGIARRSKITNEVVSMTSNSQKNIIAIAFATDFVQGKRFGLFRFGSFCRYYLIGHTLNFFSDYIFHILFHIYLQIAVVIYYLKIMYLIIYNCLLIKIYVFLSSNKIFCLFLFSRNGNHTHL